MEWLLSADLALFRLVNDGLGAPWLDPLMLALSNRWTWLVLAVPFLTYATATRHKGLLRGAALMAIAVILSDFVTFRVLKPNLQRPRPCHELTEVRLVQRSCGSDYGLPSNHAANGAAAALAGVLAFGVRRAWFLIVLAIIVGGTRIYLGVHYPGDVLLGFVVGCLYALIAYVAVLICQKSFRSVDLKIRPENR